MHFAGDRHRRVSRPGQVTVSYAVAVVVEQEVQSGARPGFHQCGRPRPAASDVVQAEPQRYAPPDLIGLSRAIFQQLTQFIVLLRTEPEECRFQPGVGRPGASVNRVIGSQGRTRPVGHKAIHRREQQHRPPLIGGRGQHQPQEVIIAGQGRAEAFVDSRMPAGLSLSENTNQMTEPLDLGRLIFHGYAHYASLGRATPTN